jgi:hypothetical protein
MTTFKKLPMEAPKIKIKVYIKRKRILSIKVF